MAAFLRDAATGTTGADGLNLKKRVWFRRFVGDESGVGAN